MKIKKLLALGMAALMMGATACSSGSGSDQTTAKTDETAAATENSTEKATMAAEVTAEPVTLNILFRGPKPNGFEEVYQEYLNRTKDTLNIELNFTFIENADYKEKLNLEITSGADYDLVYDALWINLRVLAADNYYADLSQYFNNPEYPGLNRCFSEELMDNNRYYGKMCYIPLIRGLSGVQCVHYRQDWADEWGIGQIDSYEKMEQYWMKAKENNILPLSVRNNRGYYQMFTAGAYYPGAAEAGVMQVGSANLDLFFYVKDNKVVALAPSGAGDEAFKDFPEGWNYDFTTPRYDIFHEWTEKGFISADSLTITDEKTPYWAGQAASYISGMEDVEQNILSFAQYSPEAVGGQFVWDERIRNMEEHALVTNYMANNGLCVPESSTKKDDTMRFLNWLFEDQANHDLFELGIEGKDYELTQEGTMKALTDYSTTFQGYGLTWNPNYVTYSELVTGKVLEYRKYELEESSYVSQPVTGFSFDVTSDIDLASAVAQVNAVAEKVARPKMHGILSDGTTTYNTVEEMLKTNIEECYDAGLQTILDALHEQLDAHMAAQAAQK